MRLTSAQIHEITQTVSRLTDASAEIFLFGSRLNDQARGGDIDLLIETAAPLTLIDQARIKLELESRLRLPVDIVAEERNAVPTPFQQIARARAVRLDARS